jgi:N12 class adenine-specific DNA methylase
VLGESRAPRTRVLTACAAACRARGVGNIADTRFEETCMDTQLSFLFLEAASSAAREPLRVPRQRPPESLSTEPEICRPPVPEGEGGRSEPPGLAHACNLLLSRDDSIVHGGPKARARANIAAIQLLKELTASGRQADPTEQQILVQYVGWGGLPQLFDERQEDWGSLRAALHCICSDNEYRAMRRSTQDAHYTSLPIVDAMWRGLTHLGFAGGRVLEPAVGTGHFLGLMPGVVRQRSTALAIELDPITAQIAQQLYPGARIHGGVGFQQFGTRDASFDLVLGNPPFGSQSVLDPHHRELSGLSVHNYFFCRGVQALRPGGVLAMVVSMYLMDAEQPRARQYLFERTRLLGAIRLPSSAFLESANTQVTTDIVFLQRRETDEAADELDWTRTELVEDPTGGDPIRLNVYFRTHPEQILGRLQRTRDGAAFAAQPTVLATGDWTQQLLQRIERLPCGIVRTDPRVSILLQTSEPHFDSDAVGRAKLYGLFVDPTRGDVLRRLPDVDGEHRVQCVCARSHGGSLTYQRLVRMLELRDLLRLQLALETSAAQPEEIESHRAQLRGRYDNFRRAYGYLNDAANATVGREDPEWPLLLALESEYDRGLSVAVAQKRGISPRMPSAQTGAILLHRVRWPHVAPTSAATASDALLLSLAEYGCLNLDYMQRLTGRPALQLLGELGEDVYLDPDDGWQTRDAYLSGPVKAKLAHARRLLDSGQAQFDRNVLALEAVIPADIPAADIHVRVGAPWLPGTVMADFAHFLFAGAVKAQFTYLPAIGQWAVSLEIFDRVANTQKWGTERRPAHELLKALLNNQSIRVHDVLPDGRSQFNESETQAAQDCSTRIETAFAEWIWIDPDRREQLTRLYNDRFNTHVDRDFDGSHLARPGADGRKALIGQNPTIQLRPHQLNAVWRMVQTRGGLLDHVVGAGKTYAIIATIMELRRLGLVQRPLIIVPNHLLLQWASAFQELYPGTQVLVAGKEDFQRERRQQLFARIATCQWDAVIVAHSSFGFIDLPAQELKEFLSEQIRDLETSIRLAEANEGRRGRSVKRMQKLLDSIQSRLQATIESQRRDRVVDFSEIGIDFLAVDESHEYKNLAFSTSLHNIAGLGSTTGSQKAMDLFVKVRSLQRRFAGRHVLFATGTPISNTIAEMFTVQRYLQFERLRSLNLLHFDAWQTTFAARTTDWEIDATANGYRLKERLARFCNLPELMGMYREFADVITRMDLDTERAARGLRPMTPPVQGGTPENVVVERSPAQALYMDLIVKRAENLQTADQSNDNMLCITNDARKAALDIRLVFPSAVDYPESKVNIAIKRIFAIWAQWREQRGTQLVFCDLSTPRGARARELAALQALRHRADKGEEASIEALSEYSFAELESLESTAFDVYNDIRSKLLAFGVSSGEIAFIHDAHTDQQRDKLFADVNSGRIRILLGSTRKLGAGTNVQTRLVALHQLDCPWKPSEVEQREGRIRRPGNAFYEGTSDEPAISGFEVQICRYATRQTYDSRMWQTVEAKARFIEQLRRGTSERAAEDIAAQAATAAEMKAAASGNPLIIEEVQLRTQIRQLENLRRTHQARQHQLQDVIRRRETYRPARQERLQGLRADLAHRQSTPGEFEGLLLDQTHFSERKAAGNALIRRLIAMRKTSDEWQKHVGGYRGFALHLGLIPMTHLPQLALEGPGAQSHTIAYAPGDTVDAVGLTRRLDGILDRLESDIAQLEEYDARQEAECHTARLEIGQPFDREAHYQARRERHRDVLELLKPGRSRATNATSATSAALA